MLLKQSTARDLMVFVTQASDHVTGLTGATLTITASKNGAAFASISPTVTERGSGWYAVSLTAAHTDTLGDLALHATAASADPADLVRMVVAALPGEAVTLAANSVNASAVAADAVTELQSGLATSAELAALATAAAVAALPTAVQNADALLGRTIAGGATGGRTVTSALRAIRNRTALAAGTLTVYEEDDSTSAWTAAVTQAARDPVTAIDPA